MRPRDAVKHRVLFLGDSVVFGWGVREDETVSTVLEGLLTDRFEGPVGVVNTGVGSYNTVQQEKFLTHYGLSMRPDVVILLYVANDVQVHTPPYNPWARVALADKPPLTALDLIAHRSWLVRLFHFMKSDGRLGPPLGGPGSPGWTASMQALLAIQERCDDANIDFVPVFFRWRTNAEQRLFDDVQRTLRPMTLHDTAEWFAGRPIERYVNSRIDSHPNGRAHQIMAHEIAKIVAPRLRTRDDAFRSAD